MRSKMQNKMKGVWGVFFLAILLAACNIVVTFNAVGQIDFQPGVRDLNWNQLNIIQDQMMFMGGWGHNEPESEMAKYNFNLFTSYFNLRNLTPDDLGFKSYDDNWNYIPLTPTYPGEKSSVVHTYCKIAYDHQKVQGTAIMDGVYKCRIICRTRPTTGGKAIHSVEMTVYVNPGQYDGVQLNIKAEGENGVTINYI